MKRLHNADGPLLRFADRSLYFCLVFGFLVFGKPIRLHANVIA